MNSEHSGGSGSFGRAVFSRRQAMKAGGALGLGAAAASWWRVGPDILAQEGGTPTGGEYHGWWPYTPPPVGHFNSFVADGITMGIYLGLAELALAHYKWEGSEFSPLLATAWENTSETTFTVTLREDVTWSDGATFSANDVVTTFTILRAQSSPVFDYVGGVSAPDATHVEFTLKDPSTVVPYFVLRQSIRSHAVYGEWAAKFGEVFAQFDGQATPAADGEDPQAAALAPVLEEFNAFKPEAMVVTGPYNFDPSTITSSQLTMNKVATSAWANTANFDKLILFNQSDAASIPALILSKNCDYSTSGFPPATEQAMAQAGLRIVRPPIYTGPSLYINYDKVKGLTDPKARQALAKAIDRSTNGKVSLGDSGVPPQYMAGVSDTLLVEWVSPETLTQLNAYDLNPDEASAVFQELGYTRDGDTWTSPDGERMEYELLVVAEWADWAAAATNLADQLTAFGIKTVVRTTTQQQYANDLPAGNYQLAIGNWGQGQPHPVFSYRANLFTNNTDAEGGGFHFPLVQQTESVGEVDFGVLIEQSASGTDVEAQKETIQTIALAFNELLPIIPLWERLANDPILVDVRVSGFPEDGDPLYKNSVYNDNFTIQWILDGTLKGVV